MKPNSVSALISVPVLISKKRKSKSNICVTKDIRLKSCLLKQKRVFWFAASQKPDVDTLCLVKT